MSAEADLHAQQQKAEADVITQRLQTDDPNGMAALMSAAKDNVDLFQNRSEQQTNIKMEYCKNNVFLHYMYFISIIIVTIA